MGVSSSSNRSDIDVLLGWYNRINNNGAHGGGTGDGTGPITTADIPDTLADYANLKHKFVSQANEQLIRKLAAGLKESVGIKYDVNGNLDDIIREIAKQLPNPNGNDGKQVINDVGKQKDLINRMFPVFERETGLKFEVKDERDKFLAMCKVFYSLVSGLHYEYIAVKKGLQAELDKIRLIASDLSQYNKYNNDLLNSINNDPNMSNDKKDLVRLDIQNNIVIADKLIELFNNSVFSLENMLNVELTPMDKVVETLAKKTDPESRALLGWTQTATGTERAVALNIGLSSIGNIMAIANAINKALVKIGLKVESIKKIIDQSKDSPSAFNKSLHESIEKLKEQKIKEGKDLKELVNAAEFLYKNMFRLHNKDVLEQLEKASGGAYESNVAKSIKENEQATTALLSQFNHQLNVYFGDLNKAIASIYPYIQKYDDKADVRDKRRDFIDAVGALDSFKQRQIYMALSGYARDSASVTLREKILNQLRYVLLTLDAYTVTDNDSGLKTVAGNIATILKSIIDYMDTHFKLFNANFSLKQGALGAAEDDIGGGDEQPYIMLTNVFDFDNVKNLLNAYYRLGSFRYNLGLMAKENESYSEDNVRILGVTVGKLKEQVRTQREKILAAIDARAVSGTLSAEVKAAAKSWYEKALMCKENFYSVMEQVEIILGNFINGISKNPDATKELRTLIDSLVTTPNWFDVQLGNDLIKLYETFRHLNAAGNAVIDPNAALTADLNSTHYYEKVNAEIIAKTADDLPAYPFMTFKPDKATWDTFTKNVTTVTNELNMVTSILSIFRKIGDKYGGESIFKDLSMSMTTISGHLKEFIVVSSFIGYFITDHSTTTYNHAGSQFGAAVTGTVGTLTLPSDGAIGVIFDSVNGNLAGDLSAQVSFTVEREYFTMIMKSVVVKIFSTLDLYDVFERPLKPNNALSATRMVLGGTGMPVVYPEITTLYFRLLLLCEAYQHDILKRPTFAGTGDKGVAFVPDIDGVFAKLINLLFIRLSHVQTGDYTEGDIMAYVEEVNNVFTFYKTRNSNVGSQTILEDFIVEINRRYGVVKKSELESIEKLRGSQYSINPLNDTTLLNSRMLEDAEDDLIPKKMAPSAMYYGRAVNTTFTTDVPEYTSMADNMAIFKEFRERIDAFIERMPLKDYRSFDKVIVQTQKDIMAAATDDEKFKLLYRLLVFSDKFDRTSDMRLIMFHETILTPLALLNVLGTIVDDLYTKLHGPTATVPIPGDLTVSDAADQIDLILDFTTTLDSLIELRIGDDVFIDFTGMKNLVQTLLNTLKLNINRFLGTVPTDLFDKTNALLLSTEEAYINGRFAVRDSTKKSTDMQIREKLTYLFSNATANKSLKVLAANAYTRTLKSLLYYQDSFEEYDGVTGVTDAADEARAIKMFPIEGINTIQLNTVNDKLLGLVPRTGGTDIQYGALTAVRILPLYISRGYTKNVHQTRGNIKVLSEVKTVVPPAVDVAADVRTGYIFEFNQLLYQYLYMFFDNNLIYSSVLDAFASSSFNADIMQDGKSLIDLAINADHIAFEKGSANNMIISPWRAALQQGSIIFTSLALILRAITSTLNNKNMRKYVITDFNEVSAYVKEGYKTYMPYFGKVFETKIKELEQSKKLVKHVDHIRTAPSANEIVEYDKVIDRLIQAYNHLRTCVNDVMRQVDDKPKFFELSKESISEYRNLNKRLPFMPLSFETSGFSVDKQTFLPNNKLESTYISYLYGTRGLLNLNPANLTYEQIPGMKNILDTYNASVDARASLNDEELLKFIRQQQQLINFMMFYRKFTFSQLMSDKVDTTNDGIKIAYTFNGTKTLTSIINDVSSTFQDDKRADMIRAITTSAMPAGAVAVRRDRSIDRIINIVNMDTNIININALRRSLPFTALMNLSWTFNIMLGDLFGVGLKRITDLRTNAPTNIREFFIKFTCEPYSTIAATDYATYIPQLFRGDMGLQLMRPKGLGDQLYNKLLFGNLYESTNIGATPASTRSNITALRYLRYSVLEILVRNVLIYMFPSGITVPASMSRGPFGTLALNKSNAHNVILKVLNGYIGDSRIDAYPKLNADLIMGLSAPAVVGDFASVDNLNLVAFASTLFMIAFNSTLDGITQKGISATYLADLETALHAYVGDNIFNRDMTVNNVITNAKLGDGSDVFNNNGAINVVMVEGLTTQKYTQVRPNARLDGYITARMAIAKPIITTDISRMYNSEISQSTSLSYGKYDPTTQTTTLVPFNLGGKEATLTSSDPKVGLGRMRFDTPLVRSILFSSNLFRVIRAKIDSEVKWYNPNDFIQSYAVTSDNITEAFGNVNV